MSASRIWISAISCGSCSVSACSSSRVRSTSALSTTSIRLSGPFGASWASRPTRQRDGISMSPCSAATSWVMTLNRVLLPLPLRPTNPIREPSGIAHRGVFDQQPAGNADGKVVDDEHGALYGRARRAAQSLMFTAPCCVPRRPERCWTEPRSASRVRAQWRRPIMCVPGCQEALQAALSRRGFFTGAAAAGFAATAIEPAEARAKRSRAGRRCQGAGGAELLQGRGRSHPHHVAGLPDLLRRAGHRDCRSSTTSRRTAST